MKPRVDLPPVKIADGLYYVNGFEPYVHSIPCGINIDARERFISTMETQTISSRNVVDLLLTEKFNTTICPANQATPKKDFVYGWDC